jgi:AraC-like DNA-binding protein
MHLSYKPALPLARYVQSLWYSAGHEVAHRRERVLPGGRFQIVIDLRDGASATPALVVGMQSNYAVIDVHGIQSMMGILFRPGGSRSLFDLPSDEFYNRVIPLELVWGSTVAELRERLQEGASPAEKFRVLEAALQCRAQNHRELHCAVQHALGEFQRVPHVQSVLGISAEAGLSRRRFAQLFREQVGLTPKLYCRILRFQGVISQISSGQDVDWAEVALATGYYDQAHLAHEFRGFSGISLGSYARHKQPWVNHVPLD